jgi:hypothetical protein
LFGLCRAQAAQFPLEWQNNAPLETAAVMEGFRQDWLPIGA